MNKNTLINLGLLVTVAALALVAVYEPGIEAPPEKPSLVSLDRESVKHILIQRQGRPDIELQRKEDGNWQLLQPVKLPADGFRIDSLLRVTESKSLGRFTADADRLGEYKLAEPGVTLTLNHDTRIAFGKNTPLDHRRYVRIGEAVHLISDTLYYHLIGAYPTFVSKRPLPQPAAIEALSIPGLSLSWDNGGWQLEPMPENYSADRVTQLLDSWRFASAVQVKAYDGESGEAVTLQLKDREAPLSFLITARSPDLVLARPDVGIQYHLPAETAADLLQLPAPAYDGDVTHTDGIN